jgi:cbb3-type cytochrome oxidase cytochrome c subunit
MHPHHGGLIVARPRWGRVAAGFGAVMSLFVTAAFGQDSALMAEGKRLFTDRGCYGCHTMGASGTPIAPDLSRVGSKHTEAYLISWLLDPKEQKPGAHMPMLELTSGEVRALAAYLSSLR